MRQLLMPGPRFTGTVLELGTPDGFGALAYWIGTIPLEEWPQQTLLADGKLRPAMVNDPYWKGFAAARNRVVDHIMGSFGHRATNHMLSVVMPGASIDAHSDRQLPEWRARIHVPLVTNNDAWFFIRRADEVYEQWNLRAAMAYAVNTEREHHIVNAGTAPRIHFMFDV